MIDLNALIVQFLTPQLVSQLASTVGMDPAGAQKLRDAGVSATLAVLGSVVSSPEGARKVSDAVGAADPDMLAKLTAALQAGSAELLEAGAAGLGALIGPAAAASLADSLAQHVDAPIEAVRPALGAIGLAILSVIGQQDPSLWADPAAISNFLASQKSKILAALPSDMTGVALGFGPMATLEAAAAASPKLGPAPSALASAPATLSRRGQGATLWLTILSLVLIVAGIGYYFWMNKHPSPAAFFLTPSTDSVAAI